MLFASRTGTDSGRGRLTRFSVQGVWQDVEIADNVDRQASFLDVAPNAVGEMVVDVAVSPDGDSRFCYLGVLEIERR